MRTSRVMRCATGTETLVGRSMLTQTEPSFSSGRNSVPSRVAMSMLPIRAMIAAPSTMRPCASAQSSEGA